MMEIDGSFEEVANGEECKEVGDTLASLQLGQLSSMTLKFSLL
jgi:hypothetical protein